MSTTAEKNKKNQSFQPYIKASQNIPEFSLKAIIVGIFFGMLFGAVTVYLGLKLGLTVNASIPIAVLSIVILKKLGKSTILENNIVQTIGSAGEAIAGGVIFTIPAFIFLGKSLDYWKITIFALCGGWLGVLFMIPLRRALIVKEHETLPFPEGTACADILIAGEKKGAMAKNVFFGVVFGIVYKIFMSVLHCWQEVVAWTSKKALPGMTVAAEVSPELVGVGYIIGLRSSAIMVAGGVMSFMCLLPLIQFFGTYASTVIPPATVPFSELTPMGIWSNYIRYIGAGAVVVGGFYNLIKAMPMIVGSFRDGMKGFGSKKSAESVRTSRTEIDMPGNLVFFGSVIVMVALWFLLNFSIHPNHPFSNFVAAILMVIFGFFFVTVSCRVVGMIGTTSNPISGDTIATLMITCFLFLAAGWTGGSFAVVALSVGAVICVAAANAGNTSQDLKTGYLVGATPKKQQIGLMLGVTFSAFVIGGTLIFMNRSFRQFTPLEIPVAVPADYITQETVEYQGSVYQLAIVKDAVEGLPEGRYLVKDGAPSEFSLKEGIGGEKLPAPQARLMSLIIDGILSQKLPWAFILSGAMIAFTMILCGFTQVLAFAVGLYLPLSTTAPVFVGGLIRYSVDWVRNRRLERANKHEKEDSDTSAGSLFSSGLVAGGALGGVLYAVLSNFPVLQGKLASFGNLLPTGMNTNLGFSLIMFLVMVVIIFMVGQKKQQEE